jgi:hypothetical protein
MTGGAVSLRYTLAPAPPSGANETERPRFTIEPDSGAAHQVRFTATHLRSVDRLDVRWSSADMTKDPVKAYLAKIGAKGGTIGGKAKTDAKAEAARANGAKGGRPRKRQTAKIPRSE